MSTRTELLLVVGVLGFLGLLLWLANQIPQLGAPITDAVKELGNESSVCDGACGNGYWGWLILPFTVIVVIGLVGFIIATVGSRSKK